MLDLLVVVTWGNMKWGNKMWVNYLAAMVVVFSISMLTGNLVMAIVVEVRGFLGFCYKYADLWREGEASEGYLVDVMYKALVVVIVSMVEEEGVDGNLVSDEGGQGWVHHADLQVQLQHRLHVLHLGLAVLVQDQDLLLHIQIQVRSFSLFYFRLSYILIVLPVYFRF